MPAGVLNCGTPGARLPIAALPSVSLVAVSSVALPATVKALERSMGEVDFNSVLLLSDRRPSNCSSEIEWRPVPPITSRADYSRFMLAELAAHIASEFALCIQWDGFVLDGGHWRSEYLEYDYIGAPWPHFSDGHRVGNGGFSLRSKRLLQACTELENPGSEPEDVTISRTKRNWLETAKGICFAPEEVARQFAYERLPPTGAEFGFHGLFNMRLILARREFQELLASLEPGTIGRLEAREVVWQSLAGADLSTAFHVLRNRLFRNRR
jgi:hypothetical protein